VAEICVVGAGTMGRGIAAAALGAGYETTLVDVDADALAAAHEAIGRRLEDESRLQAFEMTTELEPAVDGVAIAIEAVPELLELKRELFARLGECTPPAALLATNTSTISVSKIAEACARPERVVGTHFFNPVHRMALVEVVVGEATGEQAVADALELTRRLGKEAIVVRDTPGFVTSRLGLALGNEAMRTVEDGVASAEDVDRAMRLGYGHPMGPLELADLVGLDARLNNLRSLYERTGRDEYRPPAILEQLVAAGRLGRKSGSGFYDYDANGVRLSRPAATAG
jgi:3-hydroxybutyryl-CoA dehydrogenase